MIFKCNLKRILFLFSTALCLLPCCCFAMADTSSLSIESPSAILIHADTGIILYEKDARVRRFPASTTKVMTAILVLESGHNLLEVATVSSTAVSEVPSGYSHASLQVGEQFTLEQLLNVLLIPSANDAANVLAEFISGSIPAFAEAMNQKALELGCTDTHFVNPSGIHSDDHYSTAYDLSLIARYAMQNETFRQFVCKTSCSLPATSLYAAEDRIFHTTNALLRPDDSSNYDSRAIGIKTGYTRYAGNCLIAESSYHGLEFISVILGANPNEEEVSQRYSDTKELFNFAHLNYGFFPIKAQGTVVTDVEILNATDASKQLSLFIDRDISAFMPSKDFGMVFSPEVHLKQNLSAPIEQGDIVGKVTYTVMGISYEADLLAGSNVEREVFSPIVIKIGLICLLVLLAIVIFIFFKREKTEIEKIDVL